MSHNHHHGRHSFQGKNILCTMESYGMERIGRFGRMFRNLSPLYSNPATLAALGSPTGPMNGGTTDTLTNTVPLGMIFFGQFIDHDITFDTSSNFNNINNPSDTANVRTAKFDLDCVFGDGPEAHPFLYRRGNVGTRLITGKTNKNSQQSAQLEKHDLPRTGQGVAIIGDPRNDENRVISQLQLAFIRFYNAVLEQVKPNHPNDDKGAYEEARRIVTWHYQWIVLHHFLPNLCGESVVQDILGNGRKFYTPKKEAYIPVEFSVAAYRFGHSMITQNLKLQPAGSTHELFSSDFGEGFSKIDDPVQIVDWAALFDISGPFQRAAKLETKLSQDLLALPFIISPNPADKSLATRNLRRGQSFLLPSGEQVAAAMERPESEVDDVRNRISNVLSGHNIDLSSGTPLWFYLLAEAEEIGRQDNGTTSPGEGLGPVGARIVAEVLIGLMELDTDAFLGSNRDWTPNLGTGSTFTMADLLALAGTAVNL